MDNTNRTNKHYVNAKAIVGEGLNLSLFIDNEVFMFAIFNKNYTELIELCEVKADESVQLSQSITERLRFFLNNYQLTNKKFGQVNVSVLNSDFTILPEAFALSEASKSILEFSSGHSPKNTLTHRFNNMSFNYFIEPDLTQLLERTFKNASIRHAGAASINLLFNNRSLKKCNVFLNFNEGVFELLAKEENNLLYYNVFNYETKDDVLYYLLFMMEQFRLDPEKIKLLIGGQMDAESEYYKSIKKYIRHVAFAVNDVKLQGSIEDSKLPDHYYFTILNQHLCEL